MSYIKKGEHRQYLWELIQMNQKILLSTYWVLATLPPAGMLQTKITTVPALAEHTIQNPGSLWDTKRDSTWSAKSQALIGSASSWLSWYPVVRKCISNTTWLPLGIRMATKAPDTHTENSKNRNYEVSPCLSPCSNDTISFPKPLQKVALPDHCPKLSILTLKRRRGCSSLFVE